MSTLCLHKTLAQKNTFFFKKTRKNAKKLVLIINILKWCKVHVYIYIYINMHLAPFFDKKIEMKFSKKNFYIRKKFSYYFFLFFNLKTLTLQFFHGHSFFFDSLIFFKTYFFFLFLPSILIFLAVIFFFLLGLLGLFSKKFQKNMPHLRKNLLFLVYNTKYQIIKYFLLKKTISRILVAKNGKKTAIFGVKIFQHPI